MVRAFLRATLSHFKKKFKFREALKNTNCLSVASFRILAERNLKSEMAQSRSQNMLLPYEISKCANLDILSLFCLQTTFIVILERFQNNHFQPVRKLIAFNI
jgi:hypothetical protein